MPAIRLRAVALVLVLALLTPLLAGCEGGSGAAPEDSTARSEELTPGEFPDKIPPDPVQPPPPMLRDPQTAVYSYLLWISFAYRTLNSDIATHAFSEYEEVRVSSYVELNRQEGRAIDQRLVKFEPEVVRTEGETATVAAREEWVYRYISITDETYSTPSYSASYDTTYTVVNKEGKGWLVDKVDATPVGEQPK